MTGTDDAAKGKAPDRAVAAAESATTADVGTQAQSPSPAPTTPGKNDSLGMTILVALMANLATVLIVGLSIIVLHEYEKLGRYPMTVPELGGFLVLTVVLLVIHQAAKRLEKCQRTRGRRPWPLLHFIAKSLVLLFILFIILICIGVVICLLAAIGYAAGIK